MSKPINVEKGLELSVLMTVLGAVLLFLGISDVLDWVVDLRGWGFYTGAIGVLSLIIGMIWMITIVKRMKKFDLLIQEKSKAVFVRELDEIEYTAWRLPVKYEERLAQKKKEMGVR